MGHLPTQIRDTSREAERLLIEAWRRMEAWEKADRLCQMVRACHDLSMAGLRARHPTASEDNLALLEARLRLGDVLFSWVHPESGPVERS